jgi:hypothetical protein
MSAILSSCGKYRYRLERDTGRSRLEPVVAFIGVNPSTADASLDDATIRKMVGFASRWGYRRIIVGNLFAYRATDVRELRSAYLDRDMVPMLFAEENRHLMMILEDADVLVPCWGNIAKVPKQLRPRIADVLALIRHSCKPTCVLGMTKSNDPKHPLMLGYDTPIREWKNPR